MLSGNKKTAYAVLILSGTSGNGTVIPFQGKGHGWAREAGLEVDEFVKVVTEFISKQLN